MTQWEAPLKPTELTENRLVEAFLDGSFPINSTLPPERELAEQLGVTRPTLREALQRLSRDGWLDIQQGKSTRVRDYWREGNLTILANIARFPSYLPEDFVTNLLNIRLLLAPQYARLAFQNNNLRVLDYLEGRNSLPDSTEAFVAYDLNLHILLTTLSGNPIFTLIFNGFIGLYRTMGMIYFANAEARIPSKQFYEDLAQAGKKNDLNKVEEITRQVMQKSIDLWIDAGLKKFP
jgi:GntR family negative regulator for fad regulon and positive regulator of fabA